MKKNQNGEFELKMAIENSLADLKSAKAVLWLWLESLPNDSKSNDDTAPLVNSIINLIQPAIEGLSESVYGGEK